jgi:sugar-specific transcriptional regulator TrmB
LKSKNFKKLLNAKIKEETVSNPKTIKYVKRANKLMKKIKKNIEKMGKHLKFEKRVKVDKEKVIQRAEELLLTRLDEYIEKLLSKYP